MDDLGLLGLLAACVLLVVWLVWSALRPKPISILDHALAVYQEWPDDLLRSPMIPAPDLADVASTFLTEDGVVTLTGREMALRMWSEGKDAEHIAALVLMPRRRVYSIIETARRHGDARAARRYRAIPAIPAKAA